MKFAYSWLKELVDTDLSAQEAADLLTLLGLEVASVTPRQVPEGIVVASVITAEKHPNADRLSLCRVTIDGSAELQVVCGAPNVRAGMKAALATEGTILGPQMIVKKTKIRGVDSFGMLCSERELGLSNEHDGIMELAADTAVGTPLTDLYPPDAIIEIELTPNRGDCLSLLGVARELAAKLSLPVKEPALRPREQGAAIGEAVSVFVDDPTGCPRYLGRLVRGVRIGESPPRLKERLRASGLRPINNIVDITNYIMLLYGQPMHAFDYAALRGKTIRVRRNEEETGFTTLDDVSRKLEPGDLLIWDADRPVALAGIMGGADSEIGSTTTDVFLECAFFNPVTIRTTSKRLGLSTDSSYRFERGVDPAAGLQDAIDTAAELMCRFAGGTTAAGRIDVAVHPLERAPIRLRTAQAERVLGVPLSPDAVVRMLASLNIEKVGDQDGAMMFRPPSYRHDLTAEADLIEEIGRLHGYDNIPTKDWAAVTITRAAAKVDTVRRKVREVLAGLGLHETLTNSITSERLRTLLTPTIEPVRLLNPLTPEMALMRTTLLGSLLEVTAHNVNHRTLSSHLFEIGKIFAAQPHAALPVEREVVAVLLQGNLVPATWTTKSQPVSFYGLKGILEALAGHLGLGGFEYTTPTDGAQPQWCGSEASLVAWGDRVSGFAGSLSTDVLEAFGISGPVVFAQIDLTDILTSGEVPQPHYVALPRYPAVERDFCFVTTEEVSSAALVKAIRAASELIEAVEPFDLYRGEPLAPGSKSIAFGVRLRAPDRTLSDKEADEAARRIVEAAKQAHGAELRR